MYDIKTYLRNIYELESSVYQQTQLAYDINGKLSLLPAKPSPTNTEYKKKYLKAAIVGAISHIIGFLLDDSGLLVFLCILFGLGGLILLVWGAYNYISYWFEDKKAMEAEARALSEYNNGQILKKALESEYSDIISKVVSTKLLLESYYDKGLLHEKYRNLVSIAYLLDSLETGRAYKLDGPDGAYQQLELEIRLDRISLQLNDIGQKLDQIKQNQYSLYRTINEANSINSQISVKLDSVIQNLRNSSVDIESIKRSLNTANRNAELTRKEIAYRNYLDHGSQYTY